MTGARFLVEGLGDITSDVIFGENSGTKLNAAAQGEPSPSAIVVRDIGQHRQDFVTGKRATVDIDGSVIWAGFLLHAGRGFWFPVDQPETLVRRWTLGLVDINSLFQKRVVFNQSSPEVVQGPVYKTETYDDTAIQELLDNWLDLSTDDLDVTTFVNRVGLLNPSASSCIANAQYVNPFGGGQTWSEAMTGIAQLPAAIFALLPGEPLGTSPFGRLAYADVDDADAPFELSDKPSGAQKGYRDATIWVDGADLANDELAWGFGKGQALGVFSRRTNSASIAEHGLWQSSHTLFNVWCQDTIDRVSESVVDGSPSSHRGHKDDVVSVDCTVDHPGLLVGQKVRFISEEYSFDDVLPIRRSEIVFPTQTVARHVLKLSHGLDSWGFSDPLPPFKSYVGPGTEIPEVSTSGECDCSITDTFGRPVEAGWGVSDSTVPWEVSISSGNVASVDGDKGSDILQSLTGADLFFLPYSTSPTFEGYLQNVRIAWTSDPTLNGYELRIDPGSVQYRITLQAVDDGAGGFDLEARYLDAGGTHVTTCPVDIRTDFDIRIYCSATEFKVRLWASSSAEPATWTFTSSSPVSAYVSQVFGMRPRNRDFGVMTFELGGLDITGVDRCTQSRFDTFDDRVISGTAGWGRPSSGISVWADGSGGGPPYDVFRVEGGRGKLGVPASKVAIARLPLAGDPAWDSLPVTLDTLFTFVPSPTGAAGVSQLTFLFRNTAGSPFNRSETVTISRNTSTGATTLLLSVQAAATTNTYSASLAGFVNGGEYRLTWFRDGSNNRVKVWQAGGAEPSWTIDVADGLANYDALFDVQISSASTGRADLTLDYVDFDYDGKPCYVNCENGITDTFDRDDDATGWGTSDALIPWQSTATAGMGTWSATIASQRGRHESTASGSNELIESWLSGVNRPSLFTFYAKFKVDTWDGRYSPIFVICHGDTFNAGGLYGGTQDYLEFKLSKVSGVIRYTVAARVNGVAQGSANNNYNNGGTIAPADGSWYHMRLFYTPGSFIRGRIWLDGDPEPQSTQSFSALAGGTVQGKTVSSYILAGEPTAGTTRVTNYEDVDISTLRNCLAAGSPFLPGIASETIDGDGSSTITLSASYEVFSTRVWRNGVLQRVGVDYTESDPAAGELSFTSPVLSTDTILVQYRAI